MTCAGLAALLLQRTRAKQREPVRVRLARHQLSGTFANELRDTVGQERAVIEEELQKFQVLPTSTVHGGKTADSFNQISDLAAEQQQFM